MVILILIVAGLILGSFINAFVWRHYQRLVLQSELDSLNKKSKSYKKDREALEKRRRELSIAKGRSMCVHCHHPLAARDLVPVLSYISLRGKCRYCGKPIEDTPLAELLMPLLFVVSYIFWPTALTGDGLVLFAFWLVFLVGFVALILYDLRWYLLPHSIVIPLIGLAVVQVLVQATVLGGGIPALAAAFWGALIVGGLFYVLYRVSKEQWIGGGDITLGTLLGLLVGGPLRAFLLIFIASLLGSLVAIPLLLLGRANRTSHLPFGPFLIAAAVIVVLFGQQLIDWYSNNFLVFG